MEPAQLIAGGGMRWWRTDWLIRSTAPGGDGCRCSYC